MLILYYLSAQVGQAFVSLANCNTSLSQFPGCTAQSPSKQVYWTAFPESPWSLGQSHKTSCSDHYRRRKKKANPQKNYF